MKIKFLATVFCVIYFNFAHAQWTVVKQFSGGGNSLEIDSTGMYVKCGDQLFLKNDTANWKPYPIEGMANQILLSQGKLYYTFNSNLNQYNFGTKPTFLEDSALFISTRGKDIILYSSIPTVKKYISPGKSEDLLKNYNKDYWPNYYKWDFKFASDDSIIIIGYGTGSMNYYGGHILKNNIWINPKGLKRQEVIINSITVAQGKIFGIIGKACENIYYSPDYGRTEKLVNSNISFNECGRSSILAYKNNVFLFTPSGVNATDTSFKKWNKILLDSNIVDAQVWGNYLYALTSKATLLSYDLNNILTNTDEEKYSTERNGLQYFNGIVYNKSDNDKSIIIKNAIGKTVYNKSISPQAREALQLPDGIYFLYQEGIKQTAQKICIVN